MNAAIRRRGVGSGDPEPLVHHRGVQGWGHPQYCPEPVTVRIEGSKWGGSMLKMRFVGRGMRLEFQHPAYRRIVTSRIVELRARDPLTSKA